MTRGLRVAAVVGALLALHGAAETVRALQDRALRRDPLTSEVRRLAPGPPVTLGDLARGRPLLLFFWTTWCAGCLEHLERAARVPPTADDGVRMVFVNVGEPASVVARHPYAAALAERVVLDPAGELARRLDVRGFPTRVLLGPRGERLWQAEGSGGDGGG